MGYRRSTPIVSCVASANSNSQGPEATGDHQHGHVEVHIEHVTVIAAFADDYRRRNRPAVSVTPFPDVYSVIGYYLRHALESDAYLQQRREQRSREIYSSTFLHPQTVLNAIETLLMERSATSRR
jgi:hypothetical protein